MSLEYPPTEIADAVNWIIDSDDTVTQKVSGTYNTLKTSIINAPYGNGEYKAYTNSIHNYSASTNQNSAADAFDHTEGTDTEWWHSSTGHGVNTGSDDSNPLYIAIDMPDRIKLTSVSIKNRPGLPTRSPKTMRIWGKNGGDWVEIQYFGSIASWSESETRTFTITTSPDYYSDYKLDFPQGHDSNSINLNSVKLYGTPFQQEVTFTGINSFQDFGNLKMNNIFSVLNNDDGETQEVSMARFKDIPDMVNSDGSISMNKINNNRTVQMGVIRNLKAGVQISVYFDFPFSTTPAVFIRDRVSGLTTVTASKQNRCMIQAVTTTYFTLANVDVSGNKNEVYWLAVVPGNGTLYGNNYTCERRVLAANWSEVQTFTYSGLGTPFIMADLNERDGGISDDYHVSCKTYSITTTQATINFQGVTDQSTFVEADVGVFLAIETTNTIPGKIEFFNSGGNNVNDTTPHTFTFSGHFQNPLFFFYGDSNGSDCADIYVWREGTKNVKVLLKEDKLSDGTHADEQVWGMVLSGGMGRTSKPMMHLDANTLKRVQGVSVGGSIQRWLNKGRSFKYAVGINGPTLERDIHGYYVNIVRANTHYFKIPVELRFKLSNTDNTGLRGLTIFWVGRFNATNNWSRLIDFDTNGNNDSLIIFARNGTTANIAFQIRNGTTNVQQCYTTDNPIINNETMVFTIVYDNNARTFKMYKNNVLSSISHTNDNVALSRNPTYNYSGQSDALDRGFDGHYREFIIYNDVLGDTDVDLINKHLYRKWNIGQTTGRKWVLLFRQTNPYRWSGSGTMGYLNKNDPNNDNYSIMPDIEDYRNTSGKLRFRYIQMQTKTGTNNRRFNDWRQTSNPNTTQQSVTGYEAVKIGTSGNNWGGLSLSERSDTRIDGSPGDGNWWYSVGTVNGSYNGGYIPALGDSSARVELWVLKED